MAPSTSYAGGDFGGGAGQNSGLRNYYETLRSYAWLIVACTVIAVGAAGAYVAIASKSYTAQAELLANPVPTGDTVLFNLPVLHASGDPTTDILTAATLVTTPQVANAVIQKLHLRTSASDLLQKISATPVGQSNLVAIQATGSSPTEAQTLANAFASAVISVRTAALHAALAQIVPGLTTSVDSLPPAQRNGVGTLGDQLNQYQLLQHSNDPTLAVAAPAELPTGATSPQVKLSLAAGLFGGLIIGIGAAFAFSALDPRLRREQQARDVFAWIPVLARIPRQSSKRVPGPLIPSDLSIPALEAYRTLRTTLASRAGGEPRAYLLTGCAPSEGKTTSAISLAVALAQGGGRVILIEADLRRPRIAASLDLKPTYGTEEVLIGEVDLADALMPVWFDATPFHVLTAHRAGADLADRLSFAVARQLLNAAKEIADFVVIDSPPLTEVIDALPLAQLADEVLIVVRPGRSRLTKLQQLEEILTNQGAPASGLVVVGTTLAGVAEYGYGYEPDEGVLAGGGERNHQRGAAEDGERAGRRQQTAPTRDRPRRT